MTRLRGIAKVLLAAGAVVAMASCVTETPDRPLRPTRPAPTGDAAKLPSGPVATAAAGQKSTSRLRLMIRPLGSIPYDGLVLPLVSPDGRFVATQVGLPPSWEQILAVPELKAPAGTRPIVYDLSKQPLIEVPPAEPMQAGMMLGRSCDSSGFLVEQPQVSGARQIGRVDWVTQRVSWLTQGNAVNAHATLTSEGAVIWSRRQPGSDRFDLMIKTRGGAVATFSDPAVSLMFPTMGDEPGVVFAFAIGQGGTELWAIRVQDQPGEGRFGSVLGRRKISSGVDPALAFQCIASSQTPVVSPAAPPVGLVYYNPGARRMSEWNLKSGALSLLPEASIGAVRSGVLAEGGFFVTTPKGLVFSADPAGLMPDGSPQARTMQAPLFDVPHIARATMVKESPLILVGPLRDSVEPRLAVIAAGEAPEPALEAR